MTYKLRPYQQDAVDAATNWMRRSIEPAVLELAAGAGKSHVIAALAHWLKKTSGKKVLCLQPSKELLEQNHEKYTATGNRAGIFSASVGLRDLRPDVIYATPGTVKNSLGMFGSQFAAVAIDEAHSTPPTTQAIIAGIRKHNANLRVIGLTATPYRMGKGYIYRYDEKGQWVDDAIDPFFNTLLYRIATRELIDMGYLTPPTTSPVAAHYNAGKLQLNNRGRFDARDVERVFEGHGRLTSEIVADVVAHSAGRNGVMLFAATVEHAKEIMASLPPDNSRMIGGDINSSKRLRQKLIDDFKARRFKYIVSVGMLTTGFDAPHVDVIAVLRKTESPGLFQQIIGRGSRLCDGKDNFLVLDFAGNIDFHGLQDDLFEPRIQVRKQADGEREPIDAICPDCGYKNKFSPRENEAGFKYDRNGYYVDLNGDRVETEHGPEPAHHGRRCTGQIEIGGGRLGRCEYRWTFKECSACNHENDIAARFCAACKEEMVDPNERLEREFKRIKEDPYELSTDEILEWSAYPHVGQSGKPSVRCEITTQWRTFTVWHMPDIPHEWAALNRAVYDGRVAPSVDVFLQYLDSHGVPPKTITYARIRGSRFHKVTAYNRPADALPGLD